MDKLKNKLILLVDDEESNIFALGSYLEAREMEVVVAKNGDDMMFLLNKGVRPDIILLDIMMPVMDGYEALHILKNNISFNKIPVIAVTAKAMKGDREKCIEVGAWDYIAKPVDLKVLLDKLNQWAS